MITRRSSDSIRRNSDSINDYKEELHELQKPNLAGVQIRSKCKLAEKFETPNAFFFMAEKQRQKKKIINEVRVGKTLITKPVQVRESVKNFYVNLFSKPNVKPNLAEKFLEHTNSSFPHSMERI